MPQDNDALGLARVVHLQRTSSCKDDARIAPHLQLAIRLPIDAAPLLRGYVLHFEVEMWAAK
jgi:hypothetical protein